MINNVYPAENKGNGLPCNPFLQIFLGYVVGMVIATKLQRKDDEKTIHSEILPI